MVAPERWPVSRPPLLWAYGVTSVPERAGDLLPATLRSLAAAGFPAPRVFLDAPDPPPPGGHPPAAPFAGARDGRLGCFLRWYTALVELFGRNPVADRYALFQDDVLAVRGLRDYLNAVTPRHPKNVYWNLYTFLNNEAVARNTPFGGWAESAPWPQRDGSPRPPNPDGSPPLQSGCGALGLVFPRDAVIALLSDRGFVSHPAHDRYPRKNVDGQVVMALNAAGFREWVSNPTLLYHAGRHSTTEPGKEWVSLAKSWMGENWDATSLLKPKGEPCTA